jgi:hypothetical protein
MSALISSTMDLSFSGVFESFTSKQNFRTIHFLDPLYSFYRDRIAWLLGVEYVVWVPSAVSE